MKRGDVYDARLDPTEGSEQAGTRPVIIVSRDAINTASNVVLVVPRTTYRAGRRLYVNLGTWTERTSDAVGPVDDTMPLLVIEGSGRRLHVRLEDLETRRVLQSMGEAAPADARFRPAAASRAAPRCHDRPA